MNYIVITINDDNKIIIIIIIYYTTTTTTTDDNNIRNSNNDDDELTLKVSGGSPVHLRSKHQELVGKTLWVKKKQNKLL